MPSASTSPPTPLKPSFPFTIRRATWRDLPAIARVCTLAFWDDVLFGRLIHPHRHKYPRDNDLYWLRRLQCAYWDWSHVIFVAVTRSPPPTPSPLIPSQTQKQQQQQQHIPHVLETDPLLVQGSERIIGTSHFSRIAPSHVSNYNAGFALLAFNPFRFLPSLIDLTHSILSFLRVPTFTNRAVSPHHENIIESSSPFLDHIWTEANCRCPSWYVESLAVLPEYQGLGVGRELVKWGIEQAEREGVCASVISAEGKEKFYQRCGFDVGPVGWSGEGNLNPLREVPGGLIFVREKRDIREGKVQRGDTKRKGRVYGGGEVEFV
jgi:GNAT superfamily N-acetyltransferase